MKIEVGNEWNHEREQAAGQEVRNVDVVEILLRRATQVKRRPCIGSPSCLPSCYKGVRNEAEIASYLPTWMEREREKLCCQRRTRRLSRTFPNELTVTDFSSTPVSTALLCIIFLF